MREESIRCHGKSPPRIRVDKIQMPKTSSDTFTRRVIISLSSGPIYEYKMKLEMYIALESEKHIELHRLEQAGHCLPLEYKNMLWNSRHLTHFYLCKHFKNTVLENRWKHKETTKSPIFSFWRENYLSPCCVPFKTVFCDLHK